jgi:hypothetical protein
MMKDGAPSMGCLKVIIYTIIALLFVIFAYSTIRLLTLGAG